MSRYFNFHEKYQATKQGGGKGGSTSRINRGVATAAQEAQFKPFTVSTGSGTAYGNAQNEFGATPNDQYGNIQQQSLGGVNQLLPNLTNALGQQPQQFAYGSDVDALRQQAFQQALNTNFSGFNDPQINALRDAGVNSSLAPAQQFSAQPFDMQGRTNDLFNQQSALLQPAFQQQRSQLASDLFGSGRLGLSLASEGAGAGQGGFVQPDAFGLGRAQSQALGDLAMQSRGQAMNEQQAQYGQDLQGFQTNLQSNAMRDSQLSGMNNQLFGQSVQGFGTQQQNAQNLANLGGQFGQQGLSLYGANQGAQQQYTQNLLGGAQGLFGMGTGVTDIENQLLQLGLSAEQARSVAAAQAASAMASGKEQKKDGKGFLGSLVGAAGQVGAAKAGIS
jgi:hypothetical protein